MSNAKHRPRFGDWLRGIYAGEANPQRDGMYVRTRRHHGTTCYELTDGEGRFWLYPATSTVPLSERGERPALAELRPVVGWFAQTMERVLRDNDHKGGWHDMTPRELLHRLREEVDELEDAAAPFMGAPDTVAVVLREAADVANFAMMVAVRIAALEKGEG